MQLNSVTMGEQRLPSSSAAHLLDNNNRQQNGTTNKSPLQSISQHHVASLNGHEMQQRQICFNATCLHTQPSQQQLHSNYYTMQPYHRHHNHNHLQQQLEPQQPLINNQFNNQNSQTSAAVNSSNMISSNASHQSQLNPSNLGTNQHHQLTHIASHDHCGPLLQNQRQFRSIGLQLQQNHHQQANNTLAMGLVKNYQQQQQQQQLATHGSDDDQHQLYGYYPASATTTFAFHRQQQQTEMDNNNNKSGPMLQVQFLHQNLNTNNNNNNNNNNCSPAISQLSKSSSFRYHDGCVHLSPQTNCIGFTPSAARVQSTQENYHHHQALGANFSMLTNGCNNNKATSALLRPNRNELQQQQQMPGNSTTLSPSTSSSTSSNATTSSTADASTGSNSADSKTQLQKSSSSNNNDKSTTTGTTSKQQQQQHQDGRLKTYLVQLVLALNIPFAYAIILVAFLITIVASSSIIAILTIVLSLTGYTAYSITESTFNISMTLGVVCASFALILVATLLIVWQRRCQRAYYYLDEPLDASRGTNSPQLSETYDDTEYGSIPVNDWAKHVQKLHADSDIGFTREFEDIASQKNSALSFEHSNMPENKPKNRYTNIVAYDHTRVILRQPLSGQKKPGFDYINANFIDGYNKPRAYIGTQGPLVSTFDDYWRMIWEQRVVIIVMITNLQERGRRKCDLYWPKDGTETYGYVQVKLLQEVVMATYTLRTFTIRNLKLKKRASGSERTVYQYHYTNWPDHGVPDHPLPVLSFVRKSAAANPPGAGAIICHCSAGCGRSGTYIVVDAMLKQIRHRQTINVVDFLKHIRSQRNYLVQTEEQYIFIHDALVEAIESGETEIPSSMIAKYIQYLQTGCNQLAPNNKLLPLNSSSQYSISNGFCQSPTSATLEGNLQQQQQQPISVVAGAGATDQQPQQQQQMQLISNSSLIRTTSQQNTAPTNLLIANGTTGGPASKPNSQTTTASRSQSGGGGGGAGGAQWSLLERQYRLVASFKAKDFCVVSALKPCNKNKNRTLNLIPLEAHRVHITPKPGTDGSDYVNATFLMGFNHLREFIVTQHPVQETFSDFWQMVYDHNSQTIVLLTQMHEHEGKEFGQFWPQKEDEVDYGSFKVKLTQESTLQKAENGTMIITRDFIMRSNQDDYELQTKLIHCPGWPECCGPLSAVFDLIQVAQQASQQQANQQQMHDRLHNRQQSQTVTIGQEHEPQNGGPIIVVDKFGGTEAATFSVLTTLYKQVNFEDCVDVYMYAKLAHLRRPGIWSSQDDYLLLYRAMESYATSLKAQQQQQQQLAADKQAASLAAATAPILHHHHQTMTLDRHHRHLGGGGGGAKSSILSKTSTMGRQKHTSQQQTFQFSHHNRPQPTDGHQHQTLAGDFLTKSQNQLVALDHNHNHNSIQYSPAGGGLPLGASATIGHHHHHQNYNNQMQQRQIQNQHNQPTPLAKAEGSPYNSCASIGANSHQHLLINNNNNNNNNKQTSANSKRQVAVATPTSQQQQLLVMGTNQSQAQAQPTADQYIYSIQ